MVEDPQEGAHYIAIAVGPEHQYAISVRVVSVCDGRVFCAKPGGVRQHFSKKALFTPEEAANAIIRYARGTECFEVRPKPAGLTGTPRMSRRFNRRMRILRKIAE